MLLYPYIEDVCQKIRGKSSDTLQAKTFKINGRELRVILNIDEWYLMGSMFTTPAGFSGADADTIRQCTTIAPERKHILLALCCTTHQHYVRLVCNTGAKAFFYRSVHRQKHLIRQTRKLMRLCDLCSS